MTRLTIGIIGGGIAGLSLAISLLKDAHLEVQVYESISTYPDYGAGLAVHKNGIHGLEMLDPDMKKAYVNHALSSTGNDNLEEATQVIIAAGEHKGTTVIELGRARGRKTLARYRLIRAFLKLMPWEHIHFGKKLTRIQEPEDDRGKITLWFADSTTSQVDCVIGADGVHSFVRRYLLGLDHPAAYPQSHEGWCLFPRLIPVEEVRDLVEACYMLQAQIKCGPQGVCISLPMDRGRYLSVWFVQPRSETDAGEEEVFEPARYNEYDKDTRTLAELVARDIGTKWRLQDHDPAPYYHRRRIVTIGDAAHATLPFIGQGASQAIEDATVLHALLQQTKHVADLPAAFEAFEHVRLPRSQKVVQLARDFGRIYAMLHDEVASEPEAMRRFMAPAAVFTNEVDLAEQRDRALRRFEGREERERVGDSGDGVQKG